MSRQRNPEYDRRDAKFAEQCGKCARRSHCSFATSLYGPEECCKQLILYGTYNCESCIRRMKNGGCTFDCQFFRPK